MRGRRAPSKIHTEGNKCLTGRRPPSMKKDKSWWRLRQVRHRDAVILSLVSAACLLAAELTETANSCLSPPCSVSAIYHDFIVPYLDNPPIVLVLITLTLLGFTT